MFKLTQSRLPAKARTRTAPLHCCNNYHHYQSQRYLEMRIQTIMQRFNREIPTDKNKKQLVLEMLSIVTDKDVTNEQIQTCIRYLNDKDAWAVSTINQFTETPSLSAYDPDDS